MSVTLYDLDFRGDYRLSHPGDTETLVEWLFPFPANLETLHDMRLLVDEREPEGVSYSTQGIRWVTRLAARDEVQVVISYRAEGASSFSYSLPRERRVDVDLVASVDGLVGSESVQHYLRPTLVRAFQGGEVFAWSYKNLIADRDIQLTLPVKLSFAQRVAKQQADFRDMSRIAPLLVIAFVAALAVAFKLKEITVRTEVFLMSGLGMALFYPLVTFLSGLCPIGLASALSFLIIFGLVIGFLGKSAGWRRVRWPAGLLLLVFMGLFSLGMLSPWRGLSLTSGGVLVAGLFMAALSERPVVETRSVQIEEEIPAETGFAEFPVEVPLEEPEEPVENIPMVTDAPEPRLEPSGPFCTYCGEELGEHFAFCPACGQNTDLAGLCPACSTRQLIPQNQERVHCLSCGAAIR